MAFPNKSEFQQNQQELQICKQKAHSIDNIKHDSLRCKTVALSQVTSQANILQSQNTKKPSQQREEQQQITLKQSNLFDDQGLKQSTNYFNQTSQNNQCLVERFVRTNTLNNSQSLRDNIKILIHAPYKRANSNKRCSSIKDNQRLKRQSLQQQLASTQYIQPVENEFNSYNFNKDDDKEDLFNIISDIQKKSTENMRSKLSSDNYYIKQIHQESEQNLNKIKHIKKINSFENIFNQDTNIFRQTNLYNTINTKTEEFDNSDVKEQMQMNENKHKIQHCKLCGQQLIFNNQQNNFQQEKERENLSLYAAKITQKEEETNIQATKLKNQIEQFLQKLQQLRSVNQKVEFKQFLIQKKFIQLTQLIKERQSQVEDLNQQFINLPLSFLNNKNQEVTKLIAKKLFYENVALCQQQQTIINEIIQLLPEISLINDSQSALSLFQICLEMNNPNTFIKDREKTKDRKQEMCNQLISKIELSSSRIIQQYLMNFKTLREYFELYQENEKTQQLKVNALLNELDEMKKLNNKLNEKVHMDIEQLSKSSPFKIPSRENVLNQVSELIENVYQEQYQTQQQKIDQLDSEKDMYNIKLLQAEKNIKELKQKVNCFEQKKFTKEKATQIDLVILSNKPEVLTNPFMSFSGNVISPFKFTPKCTEAIISLCLSEKPFFDYHSYLNRHILNGGDVVLYIKNWFLLKFGNKLMAQIFLKNLIQSVEDQIISNKRCQILAMLTGLQLPVINQQIINTRTYKIKQLFYQSQQSQAIIYKTALLFQKTVGYWQQSLFPLYCQECDEDYCILNQKNAHNIIQQILVQFTDYNQDFTAVYAEFNQYLNQNIGIQKVFNSQNEKIQQQQQQQSVVNLDILICFLLEFIAEAKSIQIEKFLLSLSTLQGDQGSNSFVLLEDFLRIFLTVFPDKKELKAKEFYCKYYSSASSIPTNKNNQQQNNAQHLNDDQNNFNISFVEYMFELSFTTTTDEFYISLPEKLNNAQSNFQKLKNKSQSIQNSQLSPLKKSQILDYNDQLQSYLRYQLYNVEASYIIIQECYDNIKQIIRQEERNNEKLRDENINFQTLFQNLPKNYDALIDSQLNQKSTLNFKQQVVDQHENQWRCLRKLLEYTVIKFNQNK